MQEIKLKLKRENLHEKINNAQCEYMIIYGEMPKLLYLDCFTIKFLVYESSVLVSFNDSKCEYNGMKIIPIETFEEFIHVGTDDYNEMVGRLMSSTKQDAYTITR